MFSWCESQKWAAGRVENLPAVFLWYRATFLHAQRNSRAKISMKAFPVVENEHFRFYYRLDCLKSRIWVEKGDVSNFCGNQKICSESESKSTRKMRLEMFQRLSWSFKMSGLGASPEKCWFFGEAYSQEKVDFQMCQNRFCGRDIEPIFSKYHS